MKIQYLMMFLVLSVLVYFADATTNLTEYAGTANLIQTPDYQQTQEQVRNGSMFTDLLNEGEIDNNPPSLTGFNDLDFS